MSAATAENKMTYRYMGKSGLKISVLSFGYWATFGAKAEATQELSDKTLKLAYDNGINFFDNAETYGVNTGDAEVIMGQSLKNLGWKRSDYVVSTKLFWGGNGPNDKGLSRKHLVEGMKASLKRLQLDYVDIIFAHRPDVGTNMEEVVRGFSYLVDSGMALYWGTSQWSSQQITEAYWISKLHNLVPPSVEQPEYNLFARERMEKDYLPLFNEPYRIGTTIWSPLNSGILTGKYNKGIPEGSRLDHPNYQFLKRHLTNVPKVVELEPIAAELGCTLSQLAIAWCAANRNVSTVLLGASSPEQLIENLEALNVIPKLTPEVLAKIDAIVKNKPEQEGTFGRDPNFKN
jgi:voltage-dependent potassium channel beta subunit